MSLGPEIYGKTLNVSLSIPSNVGTVSFEIGFIPDIAFAAPFIEELCFENGELATGPLVNAMDFFGA